MSMQPDYHGMCVLVTDSTAGVGRKIAQSFHERGATVFINGGSAATVQQAIEEMGGGPRLIPAPADLRRVAQIRSAVERVTARVARLDVLVCSTARGDLRRVVDVDADYWQATLDINLKAAFFFAQACAPALKASQGCIVNVASVIGQIAGPPGASVYAAAKAAMVHMSRMMALELARDGVRVNAFCPGWVDPANDDALDGFIAQRSPLQRTATMEECAEAVLYLASAAASYTTGAMLVADGGLTSGHYVP